jgi:hypothetical protein
MIPVIHELKKIIEGMERLDIQGIDEKEAVRVAKWITELCAKMYEKGYEDGKKHE